jgi:hypothetical protein
VISTCNVFQQLYEINVSCTNIDNDFLWLLSKACRQLHTLNISGCPYITHDGIENSDFNLTIINLSFCNLNGYSIIHAVMVYGATLTCIKEMSFSQSEADMIDTVFPDVLEIGIPFFSSFN